MGVSRKGNVCIDNIRVSASVVYFVMMMLLCLLQGCCDLYSRTDINNIFIIGLSSRLSFNLVGVCLESFFPDGDRAEVEMRGFETNIQKRGKCVGVHRINEESNTHSDAI